MAKVVGPLHSDRAAGSYSGITYREYRGQPVVTRQLRPVRRYRGVQPENRSILGMLARYWGNESEVDRALWDAWAQTHPEPNGFGGTFQLDGNQAYIKLNHTAVRLSGWGDKAATPPTSDPEATVDTVVAAAGAAGVIDVNWTLLGTGNASSYNEVWVAGPFQSPGRRSVKTRFKFNQAVAGNIVVASVTGLQPNAWYWVEVRYTRRDGQVTNWVLDQAQAGA